METVTKIKSNTKIIQEDKETVVKLYSTDIVRLSDRHLILNTGGWDTNLTCDRMNDAMERFGLGIRVVKRNKRLYCITGSYRMLIDGQLKLKIA